MAPYIAELLPHLKTILERLRYSTLEIPILDEKTCFFGYVIMAEKTNFN